VKSNKQGEKRGATGRDWRIERGCQHLCLSHITSGLNWDLTRLGSYQETRESRVSTDASCRRGKADLGSSCLRLRTTLIAIVLHTHLDFLTLCVLAIIPSCTTASPAIVLSHVAHYGRPPTDYPTAFMSLHIPHRLQHSNSTLRYLDYIPVHLFHLLFMSICMYATMPPGHHRHFPHTLPPLLWLLTLPPLEI